MRTPEFEAMVAPARLYPQIWRLLLGALLAIFICLGFVAIMFCLLFITYGPMKFGGVLATLYPALSPGPVIINLLTIIPLGLGTIVAAAALHQRGPSTLFGPWDETVRGFFTAIFASLPIYAILFAFGFFTEDLVDNMSWSHWAKWASVGVIVLLFQVTSEELFFRGYLPQQLAARFRSPIIWMLIPAILFSLAHFNPAAGDLKWLIMMNTFVFALMASDFTTRTGSLGAAIGLHLINNVNAMLIVSLSGTMTGFARWVTPYSLNDTEALILPLGMNIIFLLVIWRVVRWALER